MRLALRRKFKVCRQPPCSSRKVAEVQAKYGRPGVSGRKRTTTSDADGTSSAYVLVKKARAKVLDVNVFVLMK